MSFTEYLGLKQEPVTHATVELTGFRCPECATTMVKKVFVLQPGQLAGWYCIYCKGFYDKISLEEKIFKE